MDDHQKMAFLFPCRSVDDQQRPIHARVLRQSGPHPEDGELAVTLILTFDVEETAEGDFVPAGLGAAAWQVSAGVHDPAGGPIPVPVDRWTKWQARAVARMVIDALAGVGREETSYWFEGRLAVHCWRAARPGEYATG
jgi:hypothetical protein